MGKVKYLYLKEHEHALTWINGGRIPLYLASTYIRSEDERGGVYTPDENIVRESTYDLRELPPQVNLKNFRGGGLKVYVGNRATPIDQQVNINWTNITSSHKEEDGLIFCLCNHKSKKTASRFQKKHA